MALNKASHRSGSAATGTLAEAIGVRRSLGRAVNLERDRSLEALNGYVVTSRVVDLVQRFTHAISSRDGRALSLTGPYGSGKSSAAVFLAALADSPASQTSATAFRLLDARARNRASEFRAARATLPSAGAFFVAAGTAQREPVAATIVRTLLSALESDAARKTSRTSHSQRSVVTRLKTLQKRLRESSSPSVAREIRELCVELAAEKPLLLILDEFGKCLEYVSGANVDADLFALQELAEAGTGVNAAPIFLLTLQHLAFRDYFGGAQQQKSEWSKVQGRFQDIVFVDSRDEVWGLIAASFGERRLPEAVEREVRRSANEQVRQLGRLGLLQACPPQDVLDRVFPLHSTVLAVLPELCARLGQHERTLFSFLTSGEPGSVISLMRRSAVSDPTPTAFIRLHHVYDYFMESVVGTAAQTEAAVRWAEVATRIHEVQGISDAELRVLKAIGVLNLVTSGGALRASAAVVGFAACDGQPGTASLKEVDACIASLAKQSVVGHRQFADEYRIWHGTDFDLRQAVEAARSRLRGVSIAQLLNRVHPLYPAIASRYSQETGTIRIFRRLFADPERRAVDETETLSPGFDGTVLYVPPGFVQSGVSDASGRPVVLLSTESFAEVRDAALALAAVEHVAEYAAPRPEDHVANRELRDVLAHVRLRLDVAVEAAYGTGATAVVAGEGKALSLDRGLSAALSKVCFDTYGSCPEIKNEILNRDDLSSQAAKARRVLMEAMLDFPGNTMLGLGGYGPEVAMYRAVLLDSGIHRPTADGVWSFGPPTNGVGLKAAWSELDQLVQRAATAISLKDVFVRLALPPLGMKLGPMPVLLVAWLQCRHDDVGVYEGGIYQPRVTADLVERLVRTPERFAVKSFVAAPAHAALLNRLGSTESATRRLTSKRARNASILSVLAPLLGRVRDLPDYAKRTTALSRTARAVRALLLDAREPDALLFRDLPVALGLSAVTASTSSEVAGGIANAVNETLRELEGALGGLLNEVIAEFRTAMGKQGATNWMGDAVASASHLAAVVTEPKMRSFLQAIRAERSNERDWAINLAMNVVGKSPAQWLDDDLVAFRRDVASLGRTFRNLENLHGNLRGVATPTVRVSLSRQSGEESVRMVPLQHPAAPKIAGIVEQALREAVMAAGDKGIELLLAVLSERAHSELEMKEKLVDAI